MVSKAGSWLGCDVHEGLLPPFPGFFWDAGQNASPPTLAFLPLTHFSLPTVTLWHCKPAALVFCKKNLQEHYTPWIKAPPAPGRSEDGGGEIKNNRLCREARVAEGTLPELARSAAGCLQAQRFKGTSRSSRAVASSLPSAGCPARLIPSSDLFFLKAANSSEGVPA